MITLFLNGGPNGWREESTMAYWSKVENEIAKGGVK